MSTDPDDRAREHDWTDAEGYRFKATQHGTKVWSSVLGGRWTSAAGTATECAEILRLAADREKLVARVRELEEWVEGEARHSDSCALFEPYRLVEGKDNECSCGLAALRRRP